MPWDLASRVTPGDPQSLCTAALALAGQVIGVGVDGGVTNPAFPWGISILGTHGVFAHCPQDFPQPSELGGEVPTGDWCGAEHCHSSPHKEQ